MGVNNRDVQEVGAYMSRYRGTNVVTNLIKVLF